MIYLQLVLKESEHKYMSIPFFIASLALNEELRKFMIVLGFDKGKNTCTLQLAPIHDKKKLFWTKCIYFFKLTKAFPFGVSDKFIDSSNVRGKGSEDFNQIRQTFFQGITNWLNYF